MIVYNQAFDIYHTIFRIGTILRYYKGESVDIERLRIWDFYLAYPREISHIRFGTSPEDRDIKKIFPKKDNPYEKLHNPIKFFSRMKPYQLNAIKTLASYGVINKDYLITNKINFIEKEMLNQFTDKNFYFTNRELNIVKIMTSYFNQMPLYGDKGLKSRTNLLEYRYDA